MPHIDVVVNVVEASFLSGKAGALVALPLVLTLLRFADRCASDFVDVCVLAVVGAVGAVLLPLGVGLRALLAVERGGRRVARNGDMAAGQRFARRGERLATGEDDETLQMRVPLSATSLPNTM